LWHWRTDQYIVQRALGARDETQARRGSIATAFLKLLPVFIFIIPGMICIIIPGMICIALAQSGNAAISAELLDDKGQVVRETVFFFGVFSKRLNAKGCLAALIIGFAMGIVRLAIDTPCTLIDGFDYEKGSFLWVMHNIFFQYYSLLILAVCIVVMIGVSKMTQAPAYEKISGLTYDTLTKEDRAESKRSYDWRDIVSSCLMLVLILVAYLYFVG